MKHALRCLPLLLVVTVGADEIDDLAAKLQPARRFAEHKASFRVETNRFRFQQANGSVEEKDWRVVRDGERYVALLRSGDIILLALTPDAANTNLTMPTGRYHLDTMQGPSLPTWQFLQKVETHGSIYKTLGDAVLPRDSWEGVDSDKLTLVRRQKLPDREVEQRFTFSADPIHGYRVDANYHALFRELPKDGKGKPAGFGSGAFCPGCYTPWEETAIYDRTVYCPANTTNWVGYANNLVAMDRCDSPKCTWRDKGFIAYLNPRSGWSVVRTRNDGLGVPSMSVCNAHNDFHITIPMDGFLPTTADGRWELRAHHRLMALPPELTRHIWDNMKMQNVGKEAVFVRLGRLEDFEDQPIDLNRPTRGLTWTSDGPKVSTERARSGTNSLLLTGSSWPNLPQVSLKPETKYRLAAWFYVEGEEVEVFISGDYCEWTPYSNVWLLKQQTSSVKAGEGWKKAELEFTTPKWDPFINIKFEMKGKGRAFMDDFQLVPIP